VPVLEKRWIKRFLKISLIVFWVGEFISTHIPQDKIPSIGASDKICHGTAYIILACLFWLVLTSRATPLGKKLLIISTALAIYAAFDELTQPIVNRHVSIHDWLADVIGVAIALAVCEITAAIIRRLRQPQR